MNEDTRHLTHDTRITASRRQLLTAGLGAIAATVASALGRPAPAHAEGEFMTVGGDWTTATTKTSISNYANDNDVFEARSDGSGVGVIGSSATGPGVAGVTSSATYPAVAGRSTNGTGIIGASSALLPAGPGKTGVYGVADQDGNSKGVWGRSGPGVGVQGSSSNIGVGGEGSTFGVLGLSDVGIGVTGGTSAPDRAAVLGHSEGHGTGVLGFSAENGSTPPTGKAKTGVYGQATQDSNARGVWGTSASGQGVRGQATTGIGVYGAASSAAGYALRGSGRVRFDKVSGIATLAAGTTSKTISPGTDVTSESFVLLTPMADLGSRRLWFTKDTVANTITIRMSSSRTTSTSISWLLLG